MANGLRIALFVDFYRPDRRKRDEDNIMASFKAGIDGIADGLRIDDSKFKYIPFVRDEVISGGKVRVRFSVMPGEVCGHEIADERNPPSNDGANV